MINAATAYVFRHPGQFTVLVLGALAYSTWAVTDYIENTLRPRQRTELKARIDEEILTADEKFRRKRYESALKGYNYLMFAFGEELTPRIHGHVNHQMGRAHFQIGSVEENAAAYNRAIVAFNEALQSRLPDASPAEYTATQIELGKTFHALSVIEERGENLDRAIQAYGAALEVATPTTDRETYASTLILMGNGYRDSATGSMIEDQICDGDYVIVQKRETARNGETVVALLEDGSATLKRFYKERNGIRLQPANDDYEPIITKNVTIQGVVVGVVRSY